MSDFILKELITNDIESELKNIGFDEGYRFVASNKYKYKNFKIFGLTLAQANILKQTALIYGADCATHRETITGNIEKTDVILGGSFSQLEKISNHLRKQPFSLGKLGEKIVSQLKPIKNKTKLVGILNVTPDSFSDGGKYNNELEAQKHLINMINDGADMIDIGAESTRPNFVTVEPNEQIERLKPILNFIKKKNITIPISVDTRSSIVAEYVLDNGVNIINDVHGFDFDKKIVDVIAKYSASVIVQHSKDVPKYDDMMDEIFFKLKEKCEYAESKGIKNIIIDPGIGFGKTKEGNFEILDRFKELSALGHPIMLGVSRKSLLGLTNSNDNELKDALTVAISYPLMQQGVDYLRVHNVKLHKKLLEMI